MQYNRNKKRNFDYERAAQGALSGGAYGYSVGGPVGAGVGALIGGGIGGLSGGQQEIDRSAYDRAVARYAEDRRAGARMAGDELSAQTGAALSARGVNNSELGAGIISANRGRLARDAERDIARYGADVDMHLAELERQTEQAYNDATNQGWLQLGQQLGFQALMGDFAGEILTDEALNFMRKHAPELVERWQNGLITDQQLADAYARRQRILGSRFDALEDGTNVNTKPPDVDDLPEEEKDWTSGTSAYEVPGAKEASSRAHMQIRGTSAYEAPGSKEASSRAHMTPPTPPTDETSPRMNKMQEVMEVEDINTLQQIFPDLDEILADDPTAVATWAAVNNDAPEALGMGGGIAGVANYSPQQLANMSFQQLRQLRAQLVQQLQQAQSGYFRAQIAQQIAQIDAILEGR